MSTASATLDALVQHAAVSAVALGALIVLLRRVLGVFEKRPPGQAGTGADAAPACSHCAAGSAAAKKHSHRQSRPST